MLLWAIFTLGFMFGVFFTLSLFLRKEVVGEVEAEKIINPKEFKYMNPWVVHRKLVRINYLGNNNKAKKDIGMNRKLAVGDLIVGANL